VPADTAVDHTEVRNGGVLQVPVRRDSHPPRDGHRPHMSVSAVKCGARRSN